MNSGITDTKALAEKLVLSFIFQSNQSADIVIEQCTNAIDAFLSQYIITKKSDWSNAPTWANYYTIDKNGVAYWWECIPHIDDETNMWVSDEGNADHDVDYVADWQQKLWCRNEQ